MNALDEKLRVQTQVVNPQRLAVSCVVQQVETRSLERLIMIIKRPRTHSFPIRYCLCNIVVFWLCICVALAHGQTCPLKAEPGLFINVDSNVWSSAHSEAKGNRSVEQIFSGVPRVPVGLRMSGPTGSFFHPKRGGSGIVRFRFFGADNNLLILDESASLNFVEYSVSLIDFSTTPPSEKTIIQLATRRTNQALPRVQYSAGVNFTNTNSGKIFLISSLNALSTNLAIHRSDNGSLLCAGPPSFTPTAQVIGEATATEVRIKHGGTVIASCPLPSGALNIFPASATFPDVIIGRSPAFTSQTFTLRNSGSDCLTISAIGDRPPFRVTDKSRSFPTLLQPGQAMTVVVTFAPDSPGNHRGVKLPVTRTPERGVSELLMSATAHPQPVPVPTPTPRPSPTPGPNIFQVPASDVVALIAAITEANKTLARDTIILAGGTYTLTEVHNNNDGPNGLPSIITDITIKGAGPITFKAAGTDAKLERDANAPAFRIFHIASTGILTLDGATITGGNSPDFDLGGGGILNGGNLTLFNSIISGNTAALDGGGIENFGTARIVNSAIVGNRAERFGGGVNNFVSPTSRGTLTFVSATISKNLAVFDGGGIENSADATVIDSTISDNSVNRFGGGIVNFGDTTGQSTLRIINSTISNNKAGVAGGVANFGGAMLSSNNVTMTQNTSSERASGFFNDSAVNISNTIIAQNGASDCDGTFVSQGFNLIGNHRNACHGFGVVGDLIGTPDQPIDALLGPLQDNGGFTETHALLSPSSLVPNPPSTHSPAIDKGNPDARPGSGNVPCESIDQRGFRRIATCDIGAFEFGPQVINSAVTFDHMPGPTDPAKSGCPGGLFTFDARLRNTDNDTFSALVVEVEELTNGNLLQNADERPGGAGARLTIPRTVRLSPGGIHDVPFEICLKNKAGFDFFVDVLGIVE